MDHTFSATPRRKYEASVAFACLGLAGCTAILGDFSSAAGGPADGGAINDAAIAADVGTADVGAPDSTMPTDAASLDASSPPGDGAGTDAPLGPLTCKTWLYAEPVVLEVMAPGERVPSDVVMVFALPTGRIRVIAGKNAGIPFSVYTLDTSSASMAQVVQLDAPTQSNGQFAAAHRSGSSIPPYTALGFFTKPLMATGSFYSYVLLDSMLGNGPLPTDFQVYQETIQQPTVTVIRILPFSQTDMFTAVTYPTQTTPTNYVLGVGRATTTAPATLTTAATSPNEDDLKAPNLFHANSNVYIYSENDNSSPGLSAWSVPDTGVVTTPPAKRAISGGQPAFIHDIVSNTMSASADIAYQSGVTGGAGASITYRGGTVDYANLDTWVSTDLPIIKAYTDTTAAPIFPSGAGADARWSGDNIMVLGPGTESADGAGAPGLNALWFDATGTLRSEEDGANALLTDRDDFTAATAAPIATTPTSARWAIAWVETKTSDAGSYDTLMYNELDCQ
jgi:hypothetical protein